MPVSIWSAASKTVLRDRAASDHSAISSALFKTGVRRCAMRPSAVPGSTPSKTKMRTSGSVLRSAIPSSSRATKNVSAPSRRERLGDGDHAHAIGIRLDHGSQPKRPPRGA